MRSESGNGPAAPSDPSMEMSPCHSTVYIQAGVAWSPRLAGGDAVIRGGEGEFRAQTGAGPAGAVQDDPAAERLHAVFQAGQAAAPGQAGAAGAVVADGDAQETVGAVCLDVDGRCAGVLGRVGQCLGDDVVGADLDRLGEPSVGTYLKGDGDRGAAGERVEREAEAAFGQDRGVDAAGDLA